LIQQRSSTGYYQWFQLHQIPNDRNKPSGDINDMMLSGETINSSELIEQALMGRKYALINMHQDALLKKMFDWLFTSTSWT
jgi:hypothetical protein